MPALAKINQLFWCHSQAIANLNLGNCGAHLPFALTVYHQCNSNRTHLTHPSVLLTCYDRANLVPFCRMLRVKPHPTLPSGSELPCSDDTPVDNENQNFIPNYLLFLLREIWKERNDWYLGVDMGVYHTTGVNPRDPVVPDGFLSLGVPRRRESGPRSNYTIWEEDNVTPQFAIEVVSKTYNNEYDRTYKKPKNPKPGEEHKQKTLPGKFGIYEKMGVLYYAIYNPEFWRRDDHNPLEIYKLVRERYELQAGEPYWMPEIGLGLGRCQVTTGGLELEVLSWFDERGDRHLFSEEVVDRAEARAELECQLRRQAEARAELERQERDRERQLREQAEVRSELERQERDRERQLRERAEARGELERQERDRERQLRERAEATVDREQVLREEAEARAELERQRRERAEARLRELGIDPNEL